VIHTDTVCEAKPLKGELLTVCPTKLNANAVMEARVYLTSSQRASQHHTHSYGHNEGAVAKASSKQSYLYYV